MATPLPLTPDELLTTTRAVRRRLDLTRQVEPEVIRECLEIALQAPTGSSRQLWHFVVVTDRVQIAALADLYRRGGDPFRAEAAVLGSIEPVDPERFEAQKAAMHRSSGYLFDHLHEVPGMLIPCITGRLDQRTTMMATTMLGSVIQAAWSFMLAARSRGIGTVWTTVHLALEREAAAVLDLPYDEVSQVALIPFGYYTGESFKPAPREPLDRVLHWDRW